MKSSRKPLTLEDITVLMFSNEGIYFLAKKYNVRIKTVQKWRDRVNIHTTVKKEFVLTFD